MWVESTSRAKRFRFGLRLGPSSPSLPVIKQLALGCTHSEWERPVSGCLHTGASARKCFFVFCFFAKGWGSELGVESERWVFFRRLHWENTAVGGVVQRSFSCKEQSAAFEIINFFLFVFFFDGCSALVKMWEGSICRLQPDWLFAQFVSPAFLDGVLASWPTC